MRSLSELLQTFGATNYADVSDTPQRSTELYNLDDWLAALGWWHTPGSRNSAREVISTNLQY